VTSSRAIDEAAAIVESIERHVREARAVLATFPPANTDNREGWTAAVALRDELGGYLLAATTLSETGVAPQIVTELLQRGAALAEGRLDRLGGIKEARPA